MDLMKDTLLGRDTMGKAMLGVVRGKHKGLSTLLFLIILFCPALIAAGEQAIILNLPAFSLRLYEGNELIREYPVGIGTAYSRTPVGTTSVVSKIMNPTYYPRHWQSRGLQPVPPGPDNPVGTRWLGLSWAHYGIHGTNDDSSIGRLVSQGCIRMHNEDVEELYELISIGTPVDIRYDVVELKTKEEGMAKALILHEDIYNYSPDYVEEARDILTRAGLEDVLNLAHFQEPLEQGDSAVLPLPERLTVEAFGQRLPSFRLADQIYIPWHESLEESLEAGVSSIAHLTGDQEQYISLDHVQSLAHISIQEIDTQTVQLSMDVLDELNWALMQDDWPGVEEILQDVRIQKRLERPEILKNFLLSLTSEISRTYLLGELKDRSSFQSAEELEGALMELTDWVAQSVELVNKASREDLPDVMARKAPLLGLPVEEEPFVGFNPYYQKQVWDTVYLARGKQFHHDDMVEILDLSTEGLATLAYLSREREFATGGEILGVFVSAVGDFAPYQEMLSSLADVLEKEGDLEEFFTQKEYVELLSLKGNRNMESLVARYEQILTTPCLRENFLHRTAVRVLEEGQGSAGDIARYFGEELQEIAGLLHRLNTVEDIGEMQALLKEGLVPLHWCGKEHGYTELNTVHAEDMARRIIQRNKEEPLQNTEEVFQLLTEEMDESLSSYALVVAFNEALSQGQEEAELFFAHELSCLWEEAFSQTPLREEPLAPLVLTQLMAASPFAAVGEVEKAFEDILQAELQSTVQAFNEALELQEMEDLLQVMGPRFWRPQEGEEGSRVAEYLISTRPKDGFAHASHLIHLYQRALEHIEIEDTARELAEAIHSLGPLTVFPDKEGEIGYYRFLHTRPQAVETVQDQLQEALQAEDHDDILKEELLSHLNITTVTLGQGLDLPSAISLAPVQQARGIGMQRIPLQGCLVERRPGSVLLHYQPLPMDSILTAWGQRQPSEDHHDEATLQAWHTPGKVLQLEDDMPWGSYLYYVLTWDTLFYVELELIEDAQNRLGEIRYIQEETYETLYNREAWVDREKENIRRLLSELPAVDQFKYSEAPTVHRLQDILERARDLYGAEAIPPGVEKVEALGDLLQALEKVNMASISNAGEFLQVLKTEQALLNLPWDLLNTFSPQQKETVAQQVLEYREEGFEGKRQVQEAFRSGVYFIEEIMTQAHEALLALPSPYFMFSEDPEQEQRFLFFCSQESLQGAQEAVQRLKLHCGPEALEELEGILPFANHEFEVSLSRILQEGETLDQAGFHRLPLESLMVERQDGMYRVHLAFAEKSMESLYVQRGQTMAYSMNDVLHLAPENEEYTLYGTDSQGNWYLGELQVLGETFDEKPFIKNILHDDTALYRGEAGVAFFSADLEERAWDLLKDNGAALKLEQRDQVLKLLTLLQEYEEMFDTQILSPRIYEELEKFARNTVPALQSLNMATTGSQMERTLWEIQDSLSFSRAMTDAWQDLSHVGRLVVANECLRIREEEMDDATYTAAIQVREAFDRALDMQRNLARINEQETPSSLRLILEDLFSIYSQYPVAFQHSMYEQRTEAQKEDVAAYVLQQRPVMGYTSMTSLIETFNQGLSHLDEWLADMEALQEAGTIEEMRQALEEAVLSGRLGLDEGWLDLNRRWQEMVAAMLLDQDLSQKELSAQEFRSLFSQILDHVH